MALAVRLLGSPSIDVDGAPARPPRGRKSWALLAYLVLAERPPSRIQLASLLFAEADDPLGALRWSLAELRRSLRPYAELDGDPVAIRFAAGAELDIRGEVLPETDGELLEGMAFDGCDAFETWLLVARRRTAGMVEAELREQALRALTAGRAERATALAARLVARDPLAETAQELLVRCLATTGDRAAALTQADRYEQLVERELGILASPAVRRAADLATAVPGAAGAGVAGAEGAGAVAPGPGTSPAAGRAAARAQLDAGRAAIAAGAADAGIDFLRRAAVAAGALGDAQLRVQALVELGGALVHTVRGGDEEGAAVLHEALAAARALGDVGSCVKACRELGFVDVQAGRRDRANSWLTEAEQLADGDPAELAAILGVHGLNLSDCARYDEALTVLNSSVEEAKRAGTRRQQAWSMSLVGRLHLLRGETGRAANALDECLTVVAEERWIAFAPWPQAWLAEVALAQRRLDAARDGFTDAFALACQVGDPCWEGTAARGLGLVEARTGDLSRAMAWLDDGRSRVTRWSDPYQWVHGAVLDAICDLAVSSEDARAANLVDQFAGLAARTGMREFVVRSHLHRARLGQSGALDAAVAAAADIDNPRLADAVAAAS